MAGRLLELAPPPLDRGTRAPCHYPPPGFEAMELPAGPRGATAAGVPGGEGGGRPAPASRRRTVILRSSAREILLKAGVADPAALLAGPLVAGWIEGGRASHALIHFAGESWVLKAYYRGGALGRWNSCRYWGRRRFLEELQVAGAAEAEGIATAQVLALIFEDAGWGSLRAWLLTRYLPGVSPLHGFFGHADEAAVFHAAGEAVARMHRAGIDHRDLHLGNIVGRVEKGEARVHIVDWDRACFRAAGAWNPLENLVRLWRSAEKGRRKGTFEPDGSPGGSPAGAPPARAAPSFTRPARAFLRGYFHRRPRDLRRARRYFRRQALWLGVRSWFWGSPA